MDTDTDTGQGKGYRVRALARGVALVALGGIAGGALAAHSADAQGNGAGKVASSAATRSRASSVPVPDDERLRESAINRVKLAVVEVSTDKGLGSGEFIRKDGYVVTNYHVVAGGSSYSVRLNDGSTVGARLVGTDPADDLAVVKINGSNYTTIALGNSSDVKIGQSVLAIGNPLGNANTVTEGIVSARRSVNEGQGMGELLNAIQTSAAINPGNSGGALVDLGGNLVGIPTLNAVDPEFNTPAAGLGFAIPSNRVAFIVPQLIQYGKVVRTGRPFLGVQNTGEVTPAIASQYNLPVDHGVRISVRPGGPAAQAGMPNGAIIVKVGSTNINSYEDLTDALSRYNPGATVNITAVTTQRRQQTYRVRLVERPTNAG